MVLKDENNDPVILKTALYILLMMQLNLCCQNVQFYSFSYFRPIFTVFRSKADVGGLSNALENCILM